MASIIKILTLTANPSDSNRLRLDEEMRGIDHALLQAEFRDKFEVKQHWAVRVKDLQGCLLQCKPDIVHFSGHGSAADYIMLEDNNGNSHPVSTHALGQLFSLLKGNIRCVVLNACYSEQQAQAIAQHIDCVIGMSKAIGDAAAISFSIAFYQALGYGKDLKTAFDLGCLQIDFEDLNDQDAPRLLAPNCNPREVVFIDKFSSISASQTTAPIAINFLLQVWDRLDPELQDALSMAYNQARREGKNIISTRTFLAALVRLKPEPLPDFFRRIPQNVVPQPISDEVTAAKLLLNESPLLSNCVGESLKSLVPKATSQNRLTSADVFVDIAKHGTGYLAKQLWSHGITQERINELVEELQWNVVAR